MQFGVSLLAAVCCCGGVAPAGAQDYPARPIRALTATSAGGTSDIFMRLLGEEIQKRWGQPIVVENRPGGGMTIGGRACAEAPNDGYTICILPAETLAYNQFLFRRIPYDPEKDFEPITNPFFNTQVLVAATALNVKTLDELAALSKAKPDTLSYVVPSVPLALFMEQWKRTSGADLVKVPSGRRRGGQWRPVRDHAGRLLWTGQLDRANRRGAVQALAVDGDARSPLLPDVPTLRELGYRGPLTRVYFGIVAPAGTPKPIVARLRDEIAAIGAEPGFRQKRLIEMGLEPVFDRPEEFSRFLKEDRANSERIVKESGLVPQ